MSDVYDDSELICNYCKNKAELACPYCGSCFCTDHAKEFKGRCGNCRPELEEIYNRGE